MMKYKILIFFILLSAFAVHVRAQDILDQSTVTKSPIQTPPAARNAVYSVAWGPDGKWIVGGGETGLLNIWDASKPESPTLAISGLSADVRTVAWSPDNAKIVTGSGNHLVQVWDAETGHPLATLEGHEDVIQSVAWSPDGSQIQ
jgi:WD40 repeat protein